MKSISGRLSRERNGASIGLRQARRLRAIAATAHKKPRAGRSSEFGITKGEFACTELCTL
jgi:hypothetical protein